MIQIPAHQAQISHFYNHPGNVFIECILDGEFGMVEVDELPLPNVAMIRYADLVFPGGNEKHPNAVAMIEGIPLDYGIFPATPAWFKKTCEILGPKVISLERFSFTGEALDPSHLREIAAKVPDGYRLAAIDAQIAGMLTTEPLPLSRDHVFNFASVENFLRSGFGYCLLKEGEIVSAASTFAVSKSGIEIQVNTVDSERGRGLAAIVSAALILESMRRRLTAHWDAANQTSARLAQRLGYTSAGTYRVLVRIRP